MDQLNLSNFISLHNFSAGAQEDLNFLIMHVLTEVFQELKEMRSLDFSLADVQESAEHVLYSEQVKIDSLVRLEESGKASEKTSHGNTDLTQISMIGDILAKTIPLEQDNARSLQAPSVFLSNDAPSLPTSSLDRYEDLGLLGEGGMGEVRRVRERSLGRRLAMKVIKPALSESSEALDRFLEEAQITAQLEHPGIVPVHELGRLDDGRYFFTMTEVRGRTLSAVISEVHRASTDTWRPSRGGSSLRRLIDIFYRVCEAVGYAHSREVVHRDLKPSNIMIGDMGEVLVVDWGVAKVLQRGSRPAKTEEKMYTRRSSSGYETQMGWVAGTPSFMPPEQARGDIHNIDARTDVFALGAVLFTILSGRPPFVGKDTDMVLRQVIEGPCPSVTEAARLPLPGDLVEICDKALAYEREDRFFSARELAEEIGAWLDGARRRDQALALVHEAEQTNQLAGNLRALAKKKRTEARAQLELVPPSSPEETKHAGWAILDAAREIKHGAQIADFEVEQQLHAALAHVSDLPEAHVALAIRYKAQLRRAEEAPDRDAAVNAKAHLRAHAEALPLESNQRKNFIEHLEGRGEVALVTDPPGAEVRLQRYTTKHRRFTLEPVRVLGHTPLRAPLEMGSYLLTLHHEGHEIVRYPVAIGRGERWCGARPRETQPHPITLPPAGSLESDEVYIPAGWFLAGGDPLAPDCFPRRRFWTDAFVIKKFPVTNRDYIAFLDDLVERGHEKYALEYAPRERATDRDPQSTIYGRDEQGRFFLRPDADGDMWEPNWPVFMIDWHGAQAYCAWRSERDDKPGRLPRELEWEKAARGVDGRAYPWGNFLDPSWCCMRLTHKGSPTPAPVDDFPIDESPFGVRGMAGGIEDWCSDGYDKNPPSDPLIVPDAHSDAPQPFRVHRGGAWFNSPDKCRAALRAHCTPTRRDWLLGFRLVRSLKT